MNKIENGDTVSVHFIGKFDTGEEFDNSHKSNNGDPITFEVGSKKVIQGFSEAVVGMSTGETKTIHLTPEMGYGQRVEEATARVPRETFSNDFALIEGATVYGKSEKGEEMMAVIRQFNDTEVVLDFNHPMAGKNLNFEITVVDLSSSDIDL